MSEQPGSRLKAPVRGMKICTVIGCGWPFNGEVGRGRGKYGETRGEGGGGEVELVAPTW